MSDTKPTSEPSIEEILGSIRRIIADDEEPSSGAAAIPEPSSASEDEEDDYDTPLELTQKIDEDGTVIDLNGNADRYDESADNTESDPAANLSSNASAPSSIPPSITTNEAAMINFDDEDATSEGATDPLVSNVAANATAAVMAKLARNTVVNRQPHEGATIEDLVKDMLRPMLREWLDENLPEMVQSMVERELDKISRRVG